ncbi:PEP-CTERM sorting domain-containing protein [Nitrogeniibacter aestuarii]|uniref:PEP-CTERM sorting domain-containing protein n=1 Tax=Nitrogeniibacter aestuarii TaxID=2815343 RepID=UPI001E632F0F|nr:PEP-CTERM sorting domain-containing protein [Nitrogeniibacter aestuarii]
MISKMRACLLVGGVALTTCAQAALHDRGGGLIYDDVLDVTWLQDANYSKTSGYDADGKMTWVQAQAWADALTFFDAVRGVSYSDWRLPFVIDTGSPGCNHSQGGATDCGFNVQTVSGSNVFSELGYMYYVNLGLTGTFGTDALPRGDFGIFGNGTLNGTDATSAGQNDIGLFSNIQASTYWSGTEYAPLANDAWYFQFGTGEQNRNTKEHLAFAWAVRAGDVSAVPEPETSVMLLAGLGFIASAVRRKKRG